MKNIEVDIVIPVYKGYEKLVELYESFKKQKNIDIKKIVIPLTIGEDNGQIIKTKQFIKENNIVSFDIIKKDFSHSLTREKSILQYCSSDIVILLTQDIRLINRYSLYNLVKPIYSKNVVYSFGKQVCLKKKCIEKYIRDFNYPEKSYVVAKKNINEMQIKSFFASDAFAALNRSIFVKLKGYGGVNVNTNEDMLYMYRLLTNNYKAKYCSDAIVEHSHNYTLKSLYRRYYQYGIFLKNNSIFDNYKTNNSGFKLALYVFKKSIVNFDIISIIKWLPNMMVRYFGIKRGKKCH